jgi:glycosyltransferase involved in cell wall biosynthesis
MRIAYLINQYPKISHSFIRREILALEQLGVEVVRVALRGWDAKLIDEEDERERGRTRFVLHEGRLVLLLAFLRMLFTRPRRLGEALVLAFRMSHRSDRPWFVHLVYLAEACHIERWLHEKNVQHLHAHFGTNSAEVAMLVHVLGGPQWSFTVHGPEEFDRWQLIGLGEKIRRCGFVVAISSYGRSQLYRCVEHQHWHKMHVVHCGVEPTFCLAPAAPAPAARRLVCVGRLCEQKGQLLLVEAMQQLVARGRDCELLLVGDGEMRSEIEAVVGRQNLQTRVRLTGSISNERLRQEILAARALVLPSFAEGLPSVLMEALALRRPVISTFIAGIPELVLPGQHGWLVPPGDVDALADAMQACLDAPVDSLTRMGEAGHKRVIERHNLETTAAQLSELFRAAVGQEGPSGQLPSAGRVRERAGAPV